MATDRYSHPDDFELSRAEALLRLGCSGPVAIADEREDDEKSDEREGRAKKNQRADKKLRNRGALRQRRSEHERINDIWSRHSQPNRRRRSRRIATCAKREYARAEPNLRMRHIASNSDEQGRAHSITT